MIDRLVLIFKYIIVALVQGIGEILPISSSGHMIIIQSILGLKTSDLTFEIFLHLASLIALILFFRKKIILMITSFIKYIFIKEKRKDEEIKHYYYLCIHLIIATIPGALLGLILEEYIANYLSKMWIVGIFLLLTSSMLFITTNIKRNKELKNLTYFDAFIIGIFQCIGIFPGVSRSGSCLVGGANRKLKQDDAAEFAFLMALPMMMGSAVINSSNIITALENKDLLLPYIITFIVTLLSTYFSLKLFLKIIKKQKLSVFAFYCLIIGIISIALGLFIYK